MSFGGPIDSMINANKSNLRLLKKRKRLKEIASDYKSKHRNFSEKETSEEAKVRFQQELEQLKKDNKRKTRLVTFLVVTISIILLYVVLTADYSGLVEWIS